MTILVVVSTLALPTDDLAHAQVVDGDGIPGPSGDGHANFRTFCEFSHAAYDDPLVHPGQPGSSHLHLFFGNTRTNAFTTPETIRRGSSTCQGTHLNKSAYWIPALFSADGRPQLPDRHDIYYKNISDEPDRRVRVMPAGLVMIAGNADGTPEHDQFDVAYWSCDGAGFFRSDTIPSCSPGQSLRMTVDFPQCWDGENLDSADHKSHMAHVRYGSSGQALCPPTHPVVLPRITMTFLWDLRDASSAGWYLSSDMGAPGGSTLHADWMNGWVPSIMRTWVVNCLRPTHDCANGELGDGRRLDHLYPMGRGIIPPPPGAGGKWCNGRPATIVGTSGADDIVGTEGDDVIWAAGGNDTIDGRGGFDVICGHGGNDTIVGGPGDDEVFGGAGVDTIDGGDGDDLLKGGAGNDVIDGGRGNDALWGGGGDDLLRATDGSNAVFGQAGNDTIEGGWWRDRLFGGGGDDVITGGSEDRIWGGPGSDQCVSAGALAGCE